jgi:hypothetical protein
MAEKMRDTVLSHFVEAAAKSPKFAAKVDLPPKAQMPEFKTRATPAIGGAGKISWAVKKGVA